MKDRHDAVHGTMQRRFQFNKKHQLFSWHSHTGTKSRIEPFL